MSPVDDVADAGEDDGISPEGESRPSPGLGIDSGVVTDPEAGILIGLLSTVCGVCDGTALSRGGTKPNLLGALS